VGLNIGLRKQPVLRGAGSLGVRLSLGADEMNATRSLLRFLAVSIPIIPTLNG
jgi:hypothetical protein